MLRKYLIPLGLGLTVAAGLGGYFHGINVGKNKTQVAWDAEKKDTLEQEIAYQKKIRTLQVALRDQNTKVIERVRVEYVDRDRVITETEYKNRDVIRTVFKDTPFVPKGWVYSHDQLAKGENIDPILASSLEDSGFNWSDTLDVIGENYGIANRSINKNDAWKDFYSSVQLNFSGSLSDNNRREDTADRTSAEPSD